MKTVTKQHISALVDDILEAKKKEARAGGVSFVGIPRSVVYAELDRRLGADWVATENDVLRITKDDVNAMANARFFRKVGMRLVMGFIIIVLGLYALNVRVQFVPDMVYYSLEAAAVVAFMFVFAKKQRESRKELRNEFEAHGVSLGKD